MVVGNINDFEEMVVYMKEMGSGFDFIIIDGVEGGIGVLF